METYIPDTTTSPETAAHLDSLFAAARNAYHDWQAAAHQDEDEEVYEAGRTAYEDAHDAFEMAVTETWDLPHPELDAPV